MSSPWRIYEEAARKVLSDMREVLGLAKVEGKQSLRGASGADWEVDAMAWQDGPDGFLVIEVRRQTSGGVKQEAIAAVAHRIRDVGGAGGIVVSPLPLQKGARLVAKSADIAHVTLSAESTTERYMAEFMGRRFFGASVTESVNLTDSCSAVVDFASKNDA